MNADKRRLNEITERVVGCAYNVSNSLGCGFLEKVYENAMLVELAASGIKAVQQHPVPVLYRGAIVGEYIADLLVEDCVLVEVKAVKALDDIHLAQCLNYLKATGFKICLLINFATPRIEVRRVVNNF